jgi:LEA14-like dessication related protein
MIKVIFLFSFAVFVAIASFVACSTLGKAVLEKPKIELDHVALKDANASGAIVLFGIKVDNPNPFAIKVDTLKYDVEIGGKHFSSGEIEHPAEVPAKDKATVMIPVPIKYHDVFSSLIDLISKNTSTYRIKGEASFGLLNIPFDEKGEFKLHE